MFPYEVDKEKILSILVELSKREGALRKRLMSSHKVYPKHKEFVAKIRKLNERGLAKILKRLNFGSNESLPVLGEQSVLLTRV